MSFLKEKAQKILASADVQINGNRSWDIIVHDERFYRRALLGGSLGLGESYMDGWWDCRQLDEFIFKIMAAKLSNKVKGSSDLVLYLASRVVNNQTKRKAFEVGRKHYDIGNDLYMAMLGGRMAYTCGYWSGNPGVTSLDEAQEAKLDLVCRKLDLRAGQKILDIGCGWGSFAKFAAEKYGVSVVGITISKEQAALATKLCRGLQVEIRVQDYRDVREKFDHIVSLGMFEHVGYKNYRTYMEIVSGLLNDGGLFLLHTIGGNHSASGTDPWIDKYIFPNGMLPSIKQIGVSIENIFVMEDWHNFGVDYDKTLMVWEENFKKNWDSFKINYSERFYRMWNYYLLSCAGSFRSRHNQLWQIVLSKNGVPGGYESVR